jgi:hypothetical protein
MFSIFHPAFKLRRAYLFQLLTVLGFALIYGVLESLKVEESILLLPGIVGGVYFLILRLIFHHLPVNWVVLSTLAIVLVVDFLVPLWLLGWARTDWLGTIRHLPLALMIASLEIFLEEEIELTDELVEG